MTQIAGEPIGKVERGGRDAAQRNTERYAWHRRFQAQLRDRCRIGRERCPSLQHGERKSSVSEHTRHIHIVAGLRTATVTCVGVATIAAAIGAGGLGELIFRGVASVDNSLVLAGAIPAALLALVADAALGLVETKLAVRRT